jgi:hypothetical protein
LHESRGLLANRGKHVLYSFSGKGRDRALICAPQYTSSSDL